MGHLLAFFAAVVAPVTFTRLPPEMAGRFVRGLFPVYYLWVLGTSAAGAVALSLQTARSNLAAQRLYESLGWKRDEEFVEFGLTV